MNSRSVKEMSCWLSVAEEGPLRVDMSRPMVSAERREWAPIPAVREAAREPLE